MNAERIDEIIVEICMFTVPGLLGEERPNVYCTNNAKMPMVKIMEFAEIG